MLLKFSYIVHLLLNKLFYNMLICCSRNCFFQKNFISLSCQLLIITKSTATRWQRHKKKIMRSFTQLWISQNISAKLRPYLSVVSYYTCLWYGTRCLQSRQNEWCIYIALYCVLLYTQNTLQSCGGSLLNYHLCAASTWMMRRLPQDTSASALTTHQLQVERRESHRANQVDGDY